MKLPLLLHNFPCETFTLSGALEFNDTQIIVIPGNPGMVDFYCHFMQYIWNELEGKITISAVSHAGHTNWIGYDRADIPRDRGAFSLDDQIQHKLKYLEYLQKQADEQRKIHSLEPKKLRFILIGHSVGSYICLKMQQKNDSVIKIFHLFPTFQKLYEGLSPVIRWLVQPGFRHVVSFFTGIVPRSWKFYLVRQYSTGLSDASQSIVAQGFNRYSVLYNVLYMAKTEAVAICELDRTLLEPLENSIFIYGTSDQYTPLPQIEQFRKTVPEAFVIMADDDVKHAFCVCPSQSSKVARMVLGHLSSILPK